jgi:hypothetical protein
VLSLAALLVLTPKAVVVGQSVRQWLQEAGLSSEEFATLDRGEAVVRIPKGDDPTRLALLAIVHVGVTQEVIRGMAQDVAGMVHRNEQVLQAGAFSDDPSWEDARDLHLPDRDIEDLEKCTVGNCKVKLTAPGIDSLHQSVDWSTADRASQVNRYMAGWLAGYLRGYQESGSEALALYADKTEPHSAAEGLDVLLGKNDLLIEYDEQFFRYAAEYPAGESAGAENLFYWTVEDMSLKPTLSLYHMAIRGGSDDQAALLLSKQIYASHYIQAGVTVYAALPASDEDMSKGVYLILTQQLQFDGSVGGVQRRALENGAKKAARSQLEIFKAHAEAEAGS